MRKHCTYYYKSYDSVNLSEIDRINNEYFNDYGINLGSNKNREFDYDALISKCDCKNLKKIADNRKNNSAKN